MDRRTIRRELVEMTWENQELRREVRGNQTLLKGLTENLGRAIDDRVGAVLHTFVYTKLTPF